jgi:hypothetical protein
LFEFFIWVIFVNWKNAFLTNFWDYSFVKIRNGNFINFLLLMIPQKLESFIAHKHPHQLLNFAAITTSG